MHRHPSVHQSSRTVRAVARSLCALLVVCLGCGPKKVAQPSPAPPPFPEEEYRELIRQGDQQFGKHHLLGWLRAEELYGQAARMRSSQELEVKLEHTRLLRTLRQRQERQGRLDRKGIPQQWCAAPATRLAAALCQILGGLSEGEGRLQSNAPEEPLLLRYAEMVRLQQSGDEDGYAEMLKANRQSHPESPLFLYHDFPSDGEKWGALKARFPEFAELDVWIGEEHFRAQRPGQSIDAFKRALELVEDYPRALLGLADVHFFSLRDYPQACWHYQRALDIQPDSLSALFGKGICLHYSGSYAQSSRTLDSMLRTLESEQDAHGAETVAYYRGQAHYYLAYNHHLGGDPIEARRLAEEARRDLPRSAEVSYLKGVLAYEDGLLEPADQHFLFTTSSRGFSNCRAYHYMGLIRVAWGDINFSIYFLSAADCLQRNMRAMLGELANISSSDLSEEQKLQVRQIRLRELGEFRSDALSMLAEMEEKLGASALEIHKSHLQLVRQLRLEIDRDTDQAISGKSRREIGAAIGNHPSSQPLGATCIAP